MGKKLFFHVYIFCLLQTLSAPLWHDLNHFSPPNEANFVALPLRPFLNQNNICLLHNYSASSSQFKNRVYFSPPLQIREIEQALFVEIYGLKLALPISLLTEF